MHILRLSLALFFSGFLLLSNVVPVAAAESINRRDAFLLIWQSINRPATKVSEKPYIDVGLNDPGFLEITYAKARGILDDTEERFRPADSLKPLDALLWLFRTRNVEPIDANGVHAMMELPESKDVVLLTDHYGLEVEKEGTSMSREGLLTLMRTLDEKLQSEEHEVSLYSEKFHGDGTAFGETFDMYALTAAHRTFPHNTLVRVTNVANGKSVVVRINDRGPFVQGRDMDLSLQSFTQIAERSLGKIMVRFDRLGDVNLVHRCKDDRYQQRIAEGVRLSPGIPHVFPLGETLSLTSLTPFVVRDVFYPDGTNVGVQKWVTRGKTFEFIPSVEGVYRFLVGTKTGRIREMRMEVVSCGQ